MGYGLVEGKVPVDYRGRFGETRRGDWVDYGGTFTTEERVSFKSFSKNSSTEGGRFLSLD